MIFRSSKASPFSDKQRLVYHGAYHKMGTVWLMRVMESISKEYGLKFQKFNQKLQVAAETEVVFSNHSHLDVEQLGDFVGSHMIRDPRDCVVSGYFYHLWTDESWVHKPRPDLGGKSYQEHLRSLSTEDGLVAEIKNFAAYATMYRLTEWNYDDPRILELKYEDLLANETQEFERLFRHYGFSQNAILRSLKLADELSFDRVSGRSVGESNSQKHLRSGKPGQWKEHFSKRHIESMQENVGELIVLMGYERNLDW